MRRERKKSSFTLVELLMVMVIVTVVLCLLLPSLQRAKSMARRYYCLNNIKQTAQLCNVFKADNGRLPYSSTWLVDFSFVDGYIKDYSILECPESGDSVQVAADLNGNTSYHYMGSKTDWQKMNLKDGDGLEWGFDATNPDIANLLNARQDMAIYDKSSDVHYGYYNVVLLESMTARSDVASSYKGYWSFADSGNLDFDGLDVGDDVAGLDEINNDAGDELDEDAGVDVVDGKSNNGHGNNEDGVDCSNPGKSKEGEDSDPTVDDETKGGTGNEEQNQEENEGEDVQNQDENQDEYQGEETVDDGNDDANDNQNQNEGTVCTDCGGTGIKASNGKACNKCGGDGVL